MIAAHVVAYTVYYSLPALDPTHLFHFTRRAALHGINSSPSLAYDDPRVGFLHVPVKREIDVDA